MLTQDQYCDMEACHIPANMVPRCDIVFTDDKSFVCRDCTAHTIEVTDGKVKVKTEAKQTTKQRMKREAKEDQEEATRRKEQTAKLLATTAQKVLVYDAAGKVEEKVVDLVEDPPGSKKFVLSLPRPASVSNPNPSTETKPRAYVDAYGNWRNKKTDEIIKDADGNPIHVTH
jgi:uncharacterized C2H2 Zn-finger protein